MLYRYDCVIVPDFGGFVANWIGAKIHEPSQTCSPPTKQVGFNPYLTHNDGLLASHVASSENIRFEQANGMIAKRVAQWNSVIKVNPLVIDGVGSFSLNDQGQLVFNPDDTVNFLRSSFGMEPLELFSIGGEHDKQRASVAKHNTSKKRAHYLKYAASALIFIPLAYAGWVGYENRQEQMILEKNQQALQAKIQSSTFVVDLPLPLIELKIKKELPKPYHVIAGAFRSVENAHIKVNQLKKKGYQAKILGKNEWGLTQVAYASFYDKKKAYQQLASIKKVNANNAWLLIKKFE